MSYTAVRLDPDLVSTSGLPPEDEATEGQRSADGPDRLIQGGVARATTRQRLNEARRTCSPLLTAREVGERLGVSTETVLRWTRSGVLPGFRLPGGALRYEETDVADWLARRATSTEPPARSGDHPPGVAVYLGLKDENERGGDAR